MCEAPVASITSVKYTDLAGAEQTLAGSAYALSLYGDSRRLAPTFGNTWPSTRDVPDAVRVRFVAGYTTAPKALFPFFVPGHPGQLGVFPLSDAGLAQESTKQGKVVLRP